MGTLNIMIAAKQTASVSPELLGRIAQVRLLLLDVDGVLTDGRLYLDDHGVESKQFYTRDGFALVWVRQYGLLTGAISGRRSPATEMRCKDLKFDEVHLGAVHKLPVLQEILERRSMKREDVAYVGDDILDLPVMKNVGISACPSDSHPEVLKRADLILHYPGGGGAVRELVDLWLKATGRGTSALEDIYHGRF